MSEFVAERKRWLIYPTGVTSEDAPSPIGPTLPALLNRLEKLSLRTGPLINFDRIGLRAALTATWIESAKEIDCFIPPGRSIEKHEYQIEEPVGDWYVRLLASVDACVRSAGEYDAAVLNLSFGPPGAYKWPFRPEEPFLQALRIAMEAGVIVILAAGNDGEQGDHTMNPWSRPSWVISVGACDTALTKVEPWSSRGDPQDALNRPFVVADGFTRDGENGTSFAAPKVAGIARAICELLVRIARPLKIPQAVYRPNLLAVVKKILKDISFPIMGPAHQVGHGGVSPEGLEKWITNSSSDELKAIFRILGFKGDFQTNTAIEQMLDPSSPETQPPRTTIFTVDQNSSWSRPAHASGIVPLKAHSGRVFITSAKPRLGNLFDVAAWELTDHDIFQFAMDPVIRRGRMLQVGPGQPFETIGAALAVASRFDFVHIFAGTYVESVSVPSGVFIVANPGVILTHPEKTPLVLHGIRDVTISRLKVMSGGDRESSVVLTGCNNVEFKDCEFIGINANGIEIHRGIRVSLTRCTISGGVHGAIVFISYSTKFLDCKLLGEKIGILAFHSALRLEDTEVRAAEAALLLMPPFQIWPELRRNAMPNGDMIVEWVDFLIPFHLNLNEIFSTDNVPPGTEGELMSEVRSTLAKHVRFEAKGHSIVSSIPSLITLESCIQIPPGIASLTLMNHQLPSLDLEHVSYKESHAAAQAYLGKVTIGNPVGEVRV